MAMKTSCISREVCDQKCALSCDDKDNGQTVSRTTTGGAPSGPSTGPTSIHTGSWSHQRSLACIYGLVSLNDLRSMGCKLRVLNMMHISISWSWPIQRLIQFNVLLQLNMNNPNQQFKTFCPISIYVCYLYIFFSVFVVTTLNLCSQLTFHLQDCSSHQNRGL